MKDDITNWIAEAKNSDPQGAERIWDRYFEQLVAFARRKLTALPRRAVDEEDVALSAMDSYFQGLKQGRFQPRDRDELWKLLATITVRKATRELRRHYAAKRGGGGVRGESVFSAAPESEQPGINEVMAADQMANMSQQLTATCREMLEKLPEDSLRELAQLRMAGFSNTEISEKLNVSPATTKRRLAKIREIWSADTE